MSMWRRMGLRRLAARVFGALSECRGSSAVEFAFVAPIVLFFTVGVLDVGRVVWFSATLESAASDTARFAMLRGADSNTPASAAEITAYATGQATGIPAGGLDVNVNWTPNNNPGGSVKITLTHNFQSYLIGFIDFGPFLLKGTASRVVL